MLVLKSPTNMRPGALSIMSTKLCSIVLSLGVRPGRSVVVLSDNNANTPSFPSSSKRSMSVRSWSNGFGSNLKSPVLIMRPTGVSTITIVLPGIECVTLTSSTKNTPTFSRSCVFSFIITARSSKPSGIGRPKF